jgi:hypothetical protein
MQKKKVHEQRTVVGLLICKFHIALECECNKAVTESMGLLSVLRFTNVVGFRIVVNKGQKGKRKGSRE